MKAPKIATIALITDAEGIVNSMNDLKVLNFNFLFLKYKDQTKINKLNDFYNKI
jgi:hypothetical protein